MMEKSLFKVASLTRVHLHLFFRQSINDHRVDHDHHYLGSPITPHTHQEKARRRSKQSQSFMSIVAFTRHATLETIVFGWPSTLVPGFQEPPIVLHQHVPALGPLAR